MKELYTYEDIENFVNSCNRCPLSKTRNKAVMGRGSLNAKIMFIAEAPGVNEDRDGIPFTGRSGVVFDEMLRNNGLTRDDVYITNIVKCHPPKNRDPEEFEKERCIEFLKYETYILKPEVIVCLGRVAAQRIIRKDYKITREHGTMIYRKNTWLTSLYHPSALLRDPSKKQETFEDMRKIVERIR